MLIAAGSALMITSCNAEPTATPPTDPVTSHFFPHTPASGARLDHAQWSEFLSRTVVYAGYAKSRLAHGAKRTWAGSRMRFGNAAPSRYDNNRVVLAAFTDQHVAFVRDHRRALEAVPSKLPLAALDRDEQLAYWLNLYNVRVLELLTEHYPTETTKLLRKPPHEQGADAWVERTLEVDGVALSLRDIESRILFPLWDSPLVLYGLWQGAIGGPRLPLRAFEGARVWTMLEENADEFINSNRGMTPRGRTLKVSLLYGWGGALFENDEHLLDHIQAYARPPFSEGLSDVERLQVKLYDWHLADLSGGTLHRGTWNTSAALLGAFEGGGARTNLLTSQAILSDDTRGRLSGQSMSLLRNMERHNDRQRSPVVTIDECDDAVGCDKEQTGPGDAAEQENGD